MSHCPLCETDDIGDGELISRLLEEHWPEDGRRDCLGLKRDIESDYDVSLSVTQLKRHLDDHIRWGLDIGGGGA